MLMPTGAFDVGLPWPRPDCEAADQSDLTRQLCTRFIYSEPLYEMQVSTIVLAGSPLVEARSTSLLSGKTICRPAGFPPVDIERLRLEIRIVTDMTARKCAALLLDGGADAVSLPAAEAERLLAAPEFADRIARARYLGASVPVHALALRDAPGRAT